jgi:hypothetical protein
MAGTCDYYLKACPRYWRMQGSNAILSITAYCIIDLPLLADIFLRSII